MSDVLLIVAIVAFFLAATLLLRACRRIIASSVDEAEREERSFGHEPERGA
jgi:hypothetical protein